MLNACTIDVEDYFHVSAFDGIIPRSSWSKIPSRIDIGINLILDQLAQANTRATFFILGTVAESQPELVRRIHSAGHEIACHSFDHQLVYNMTPVSFREDVRRCKQLLEDIVGTRITIYRAPSFSITTKSIWGLRVLAEEGFEIDSSIYPIIHDRYGIPHAPAHPYRLETGAGALIEFPPTTFRLMGMRMPAAGGGYFRLYPYWLTKLACEQTLLEARPIHLYVHPWEFDVAQPRVEGASTVTRWRHTVGIRRTLNRFGKILNDFAFDTVSASLESLSIRDKRRVSQDQFRLDAETVVVGK